MLRFATCVIIFAILSPLIIADNPCNVTDSTKGTIDISSLSATDGKAKFPDLTPTESGGNWKYSFNPCKPFSEDSCTNAAACQVEASGPDRHILAVQNNVQWDTKPGTTDNPTLSYTYQSDTGQKNVQIEMICTPDSPDSLEVLGEVGVGNYQFKLTSKCACWNGCPGIPPQKNCSIDGSVYTSDKQVIESFPFDVSINPPLPHPSPPTSSYAVVDIKGHVIELTLVNIESVPPAVFCLSQVQVLSFLDSTDLSIPPEISRLASSLISFSVSNTSASLILPPELFNMPVLSTLSIVNSGLETLSEDIGKLEKLTQLTLDGNQLLTLPGALSKLPSLTYLSVNNNPRLSSLDVLNGSTSLITLRGSNCLIDHLPTNINNLRTIEMTGNRLTSLDNMETITSESCDLLSFGGNQIASISSTSLEKIQTLLQFDLSDNRFITLPDSVYQIKDLETLDIRQNYFNAKEKEWIQGLFRLTNTTVLI